MDLKSYNFFRASIYPEVAIFVREVLTKIKKDPSAINVDKYDAGWLFEMRAKTDALLSPEGYLDHLKAVWEVTQKTIKGQLNH